jgi:hypothetical protein
VLLNTDLHIANVGLHSARRMQRKTFVKNTMDLVDSMITNDQSLKEELISMGPEGVRKWKRDLENLLKVCAGGIGGIHIFN